MILLFLPGFFALAALYYIGITDVPSVNSLFLTLPTFLYALFGGFFISRQSSRYGELRKHIADFDGIMSAAYRGFTLFDEQIVSEAAAIVRRHYDPILKHGWDYPFSHKTSTITDLQNLSDKAARSGQLVGVQSNALNRTMMSLADAQKVRKNMVALRDERLPKPQWLLLVLLVIILFATISAVPSQGFLLGASIKAAFLVSILVSITLLRQLDTLSLFSGKLGEQSARDALSILEGKR